MKKKRIIPVILLKDGQVVQSKQFSRFQNLGNPSVAVKRFSEWMADELIYLDISREAGGGSGRTDLNSTFKDGIVDIQKDVAKVTFMPIAFGGKIKTLEEIGIRLAHGADKVSINSEFLENPDLISKAAAKFGSQCIIGAVDYKEVNGKRIVFKNNGKVSTNFELHDWMKRLEEEGCGELFVHSIDRDGMKSGFDIEFFESISGKFKIPLIACGGAGEWEHFHQMLKQTDVDGLAAANIFQHIDQSLYLLRSYLYDKGCPVRPPSTFVFDQEKK